MGSTAGFTLVEVLLAATLMIALLGAVFALIDPAQGAFRSQPEASDLQQRLRVAVTTLTTELLAAGAGPHLGEGGGSLLRYRAPVLPYRLGPGGDDPSRGVFFRPDAVTVVYVPAAGDAVPGDEAVYLGSDGALTVASGGAGQLSRVLARTYYLRADAATGAFQLRRFDGIATDSPVVDHVVGLEYSYFGDATPPAVVAEGEAADATAPWATYGPWPPAVGEDDAGDNWPPGENCIFGIDEARHVARLAAVGPPGSLVPLAEAALTDGPWCPDATSAQRYDADLLRVRRIRVTVRVQAAAASVRGPAGVLFARAGTATSAARLVPDQEVQFDVTPRNLNGTR
jgi:hypothetical protein